MAIRSAAAFMMALACWRGNSTGCAEPGKSDSRRGGQQTELLKFSAREPFGVAVGEKDVGAVFVVVLQDLPEHGRRGRGGGSETFAEIDVGKMAGG